MNSPSNGRPQLKAEAPRKAPPAPAPGTRASIADRTLARFQLYRAKKLLSAIQGEEADIHRRLVELELLRNNLVKRIQAANIVLRDNG